MFHLILCSFQIFIFGTINCQLFQCFLLSSDSEYQYQWRFVLSLKHSTCTRDWMFSSIDWNHFYCMVLLPGQYLMVQDWTFHFKRNTSIKSISELENCSKSETTVQQFSQLVSCLNSTLLDFGKRATQSRQIDGTTIPVKCTGTVWSHYKLQQKTIKISCKITWNCKVIHN
jgi:hypothetical protein